MWLATSQSLIAVLVAATCASVQEPLQPLAISDQDKVADYIERMNLQPLLLEHLSAAMQAADPETRLKIAERLARHYAALLADAGTPERRADIVARSSELLKIVPQAKAFDLRVGILKARYLSAESQAERVRLRLLGEDARAEAVTALLDIRSQLGAMLIDLVRREDSLSRALDSSPADADRIDRDLTQTRRWRSTAQYFAGWAGVYAAILSQSPAVAAEAQRDFYAILSAGDTPTPEKVDRANLRYEHIARAAIGLAAARSAQGRDAEAMAWLELVQRTPAADSGAKGSILRWKITTLAAAGRWADLEREISRSRQTAPDPPDVPPFTPPGLLDAIAARHLAVVCLESTAQPSREITQRLARVAIGDLISRKQLASVLDLVRQHGQETLSDQGTGTGFIARYVRGMLTYESAIAAAVKTGQSLEEPASLPAVINLFDEAAQQLIDATVQADASSFNVEAVSAVAISARSLFMADKLRESAERFTLAFERARLAGNDAQSTQDYLYLAVVTLEKALSKSPGRADELAIQERIEQLSTLFLKTYPSSERAVTLTLRSIARTDRTDEEAIRVLQSVNKDSSAYEAARRQLARLLYRRFRSVPQPDRPFASTRYLIVADEVLALDKKAALEARGDAVAPAVERAVTSGRQMLDAALSMSPPDVAKAELTLGTIRQVLITTGVATSAWEDELDYRAVQIALARTRLADADNTADRMRARLDAAKPGTEAHASIRRFHAAARRALLQHADNAVRAASTDADRIAAARRALNHGIPLTDDIAASPQSIHDNQNASVVSRVAEAGAILWRAAAEVPARDTALRLDKALIDVLGNPPEPLARYAELIESTGDVAAAMQAWRTLSTSLVEETPLWARARYEFFRLLAASDARAAAAAVQQHIILHPSVPEPWQTRIKTLADNLSLPTRPGDVPNGTPAGRNGGTP